MQSLSAVDGQDPGHFAQHTSITPERGLVAHRPPDRLSRADRINAAEHGLRRAVFGPVAVWHQIDVGVRLNLPQGANTATIESKTNFLRAVTDDAVETVSRPLHAGASTIVVETEVRRGDGKLVAKTTQTQAVISR